MRLNVDCIKVSFFIIPDCESLEDVAELADVSVPVMLSVKANIEHYVQFVHGGKQVGIMQSFLNIFRSEHTDHHFADYVF